MAIRSCLFFFLLAGADFAQSPQSIVITSAASFQPGLPPKGSIGTAFCTGLQMQGVVSAVGYPLPRTLSGISITVGGALAPIFSVAEGAGYQQINFQVPQEAMLNQQDGTWTVAVVQNGSRITAQVATVQSPGDFFRIASSFGAFQHAADFSLVTEQNPAQSGEVLVGYLTGLPESRPAIPTGEATPLSPLFVVPQFNVAGLVDQFAVLLNGTVAANSCPVINTPCPATSILFLGLTPGTVGVYQVNFVVPASTESGNMIVRLQRSRCVNLFGTPCTSVDFNANATVGCKSSATGATREVCTSEAVLLPVR